MFSYSVSYKMNASRGFTLMEVLVATAITGIALGVLLSGFAQGHRQAFRGDMARKAAAAAQVVLHQFKTSREGFPAEDSGDIEGFDGWRYSLVSKGLVVRIGEAGTGEGDSGEEEETQGQELEVPELDEVELSIFPPGGSHPFVLVTWVDAGES